MKNTLVENYTSLLELVELVSDRVIAKINERNTAVNVKPIIFYQTSTPMPNVVGDLWYDTSKLPVDIYRWSGNEWINLAKSLSVSFIPSVDISDKTVDTIISRLGKSMESILAKK